MRRILVSNTIFVFAIGVVVACGSFQAEDAPTDGGANESGAGDATADSAHGDGAGSADGADATDAMPSPCTTLDLAPAALAGWTAHTMGSAKLDSTSKRGKMAVRAVVTAANDEAAIVHDVVPDAAGAFTIDIDLIAETKINVNAGNIVELVLISCVLPKLSIQLEVVPAGTLAVEAQPSMASPNDLGLPVSDWQTFHIAVTDDSFHYTLGSFTSQPIALGDHFMGAKGCTLKIGAIAVGNIATSTGYYAKACIR